MLAVALGTGWSIRTEIRSYSLLVERPVFSPEEMVAITSEYQFGWAVKGLLIALFLYQFFTWNRTKENRRFQLCDGIILSVFTLAWAGLWFYLSLSGLPLVIWAVLLLALAGGAAWSWRTFYLSHQSSIYQEEESQHER